MDSADCKVEENQDIECVCVCVCVCVWTTVTFSNPKAQFPENPEDSWNGVLSMLVAQDWYECIHCEWCKTRNVWATIIKFCC